MLDRSIPFYNIILRCDNPLDTAPSLHGEYAFRMYQAGDELAWAELEYEIGDFNSVAEAKQYFLSNYCTKSEPDISERCVFAVKQDGTIIGSCIAWQDLRNNLPVASLHWLVVSPRYQNKGIGSALCQKAMQIFAKKDEKPIYIHTQPWSYKAMILYIHQGFKIQKTDTFSHYINQFPLAMNTLQKILSQNQYKELENNAES